MTLLKYKRMLLQIITPSEEIQPGTYFLTNLHMYMQTCYNILFTKQTSMALAFLRSSAKF